MPANEYEIDLQIARSIHAEAARGRWTSRSPDEFRATNGGPLSRFGFLGWRLNERGTGHRGVGIGWSTPYWFLVLLCCPAPSLRLTARLRNRRRRGRGLCPACGYDLRGTPDRCPECGRAVALPSRS